ncbi:14891_t:CDS:10, partial [Acaulospora morrowiae]
MNQEDAPLLTETRTPNDFDEESLSGNGGGSQGVGVQERIPRTREAPRDRTNFMPLRHGKFSRLETILAFTSIILLILMSIFAGLYARGRSNKHREIIIPAPEPPSKNETDEGPCLTSGCIVTAAQILSDMDSNVDPCDDFYQYTCGGWLKRHVIPDDKGRYGYFDSLYEENQKLLKGILENEFGSPNEPYLPPANEVQDKLNLYKLQDFYQSCMNETHINHLGNAPLAPILSKILDDFPIDKEYSLFYNIGNLNYSDVQPPLDEQNLTYVLAYLSTLGVKPLFTFYTDADAKDPTNNALHLMQSGLGLPSKEYYDEESILDVYRDVIAELLGKALVYDDMMNGTGVNVIDKLVEYEVTDMFEGIAQKIVDFEISLAKISLSAEEMSNPDSTYNNHTIFSLSRLSPSFMWLNYLTTLLPPNANHDLKIILHSNKYFKDVSNLVKETPPPVLQTYFIWQAVLGYADFLDENFRSPIRRLMAKLRGIDESVKPKRWEVCLRAVDSTMGLMAGRFFVLKAFGGQSKEIADQLIGSLKDAFINRMPKIEWLDDATRDKAIDKVEKIIQKVGYPTKSPDTMSPGSLAEYYDKIVINNDTFFENIVSAERWQSERQWQKIGKPVDRGHWYMTPQTVNAYYNPTANEIVFPAGILQPPFFSAETPEYINFGGIGMVIGHELTHAFDNHGRRYDASGRLIQWWSNETIEAFNNKTECFISQYSNYTVDDPKGVPVHLNGRLTLGENLADNGGLAEAYHAWWTRYENDPDGELYNNQLLPGLNKNTRTTILHFIRSYLVFKVRTDPHAPAYWRVNGVLRNSQHFAKTFNCKSGTKMNPVDKCTL